MEKQITNIQAEEILDSRNNPTLKVSVYVGEFVGTFEVPSGASTGMYEACELRDEESGKSHVSNAIKQIETVIKPALIGVDVTDQKLIDETMINIDGTIQKTKLGGNSTIGVSIAACKAAAALSGKEVYEYLKQLKDIKPSRNTPFLYFNLINGGKHAKSDLAFQEFHIVPQTENIKESVEISGKIQKKLDEIILKQFGNLPVKGDEGGIALSVEDVMIPLKLLKKATEETGNTDKIKFALDVAASSFYDHENGAYKFMNRTWTSLEMKDLYKQIISEFPFVSIEDPYDEEVFDIFAQLQSEIGDVRLVGDDLTVTNVTRLDRAIKEKSIRAIIIKPNQIGTLTETLNTMKLARDNNIDCIVSHRSGETMDDFIADLAYGFGCFGIKAGALGPKERNVKYDRLIKITSK